jgi:prolyl oligopeptidase
MGAALPPPPGATRQDIADDWHGVAVPDPYRWLEDAETPETLTWVAAQNVRTRQALDVRPDRGRWHERLVALLGAGVSTGCRIAGDRVFALERSGGADQHRLVVRSASDAGAAVRVLIDPATRAADAAVAIDWYDPSPDGRLVAYGTSEGGDERSVLKILDVDTGKHLADEIPETRAASLGWFPDARGFLYTRYPAGDEYNRRVYEHRLGEPWSGDGLVWDALPNPQAWADVHVGRDGRYALVTVLVGWARTDVHLCDLATRTWHTLVYGEEALTYLEIDDERLVGHTTVGAPKGRVVSVSFDAASVDDWRTLVPESDGVVEGVHRSASSLFVRSSEHAVGRLCRHDLSGGLIEEIELPPLAAFSGADTDADHEAVFVQVESFALPPSLFRWSEGKGLEAWGTTDTGVDASAFTGRLTRYLSADGTSIGLFLVHADDVEPGPDTPCILTGYGGFAIANSPMWSPAIAAWCERGGLYAIAGLRGGLEEGEAWHRAGRRETKQNVFDDFLAATDFLVDSKLTSRSRLAWRGGSNGGLLVGAALTQRPDGAAAVHCAVPLLDMIRFPRFKIAKLWTDEYGDPDIAAEFAWLWAYSPYHHVEERVCYPPTLLTTAEGDSRVDPCHARKMAAALQWASSCERERPILLRQEGRAGHGVGKPLHLQADELADVLAFFSWQLGGPA